MRAVICVPHRPDGGRRGQLWGYTRDWISTHYDYPVFVGDSDTKEFNRGQARNRAAALAGDWEVALFHDADTITGPEAVEEAIATAAIQDTMVIAGDTYMYLNKSCTNRALAGGPLIPCPTSIIDGRGIHTKPCSGIYAVSRTLFDKVGGFIESFPDWSHEDLIFLTSCGVFGAGTWWVPGNSLLHLWHEPSPVTEGSKHNQEIWEGLVALYDQPDKAREYLASYGHKVPL